MGRQAKAPSNPGTIIAIVGLVLTAAVFVVGDNIYEQITGKPFFGPRPTPNGGGAVCTRDDGWRLYDDFAEPSTFPENWWEDDRDGICSFEPHKTYLRFDCTNNTTKDLQADLQPRRSPDNVTGVAATVRVNQSGGPLQLVTNWLDETDTPRWAYHLEAGVDTAQALRYDIETGEWKNQKLLGETLIERGVSHVLHIEQTGGRLVFCVDGQQIAADRPPSHSSPLKLNYWSFTYYVWQDRNSQRGQIERVDLKVENK
jgi:hypothetical protein